MGTDLRRALLLGFLGLTLLVGGCAERVESFAVASTQPATQAAEMSQTQPEESGSPGSVAQANQSASANASVTTSTPASRPTSAPAGVTWDTTIPKSMPARDFLEKEVLKRPIELRIVDTFMDPHTEPPPFCRVPPGRGPADAFIGEDVRVLADTNPWPPAVPLPAKQPTIVVGASRSTYRTRTPQEVMAALAPLFDLIQREVDIRATATLWQSPEQIYYGLLDGKEQMAITHIFDYLLVGSWFGNNPGNGVSLLSWAQPANPYTDTVDKDFPGPPGTSVEVVVASDSKYKTFADLKGSRLALAAGYVNAPGTFLTALLRDAHQPPGEHFFSSVTLRRYSKDALIDVLKGKADVTCVDQGTIGSLISFYGIKDQIRELAVSPRYNVDVLYTSLNNVATHRTEIEMTQRQVTTLGKNAEGQEVLFLFDTREWHNYQPGELQAARDHFSDFTDFIDHTPIDLKPLLDPNAPVNIKTYDRYGDE